MFRDSKQTCQAASPRRPPALIIEAFRPSYNVDFHQVRIRAPRQQSRPKISRQFWQASVRSIVAAHNWLEVLTIEWADRGPAGKTRSRLCGYPPHPPGRSPDVGDALISQVVHLQRRAAYLALIDAYLDGFAIDDDDVDRLARALAATAATWPWREADLWPERFAAFNLLDPADAPKRLATAMLRADAPPRAILEAAGLQSDGRRKGGLAEAGFREACGMVAGSAPKSAAPLQDRLIAWGLDGAQALAFPKAWPDFACALFKPWQVEEPPAAHKTVLIDSALAHAGDPRVNEGKWRPVRSAFGEAYDVVVRWLTKASVEQFFDIVSETMVDRPDMWAQRRAFWTQYLKNNAISAAWVAFGADGAERAKRAARTSGDRGLSMFGRLSSGNGRTSQHSALIMTIGDLTVVEWSHNGKCYIWKRSDEDQATDRVFRIGQGKDVHVHFPLAVHPDPAIREASFDLRLNALIERKRQLTRDLFLPPDPSDSELSDLFREVSLAADIDQGSAETEVEPGAEAIFLKASRSSSVRRTPEGSAEQSSNWETCRPNAANSLATDGSFGKGMRAQSATYSRWQDASRKS